MTWTPPAPRTLGPLTRTDFVRYQGASGDMNPVHHDETFATAAGYPAPLAVGMFTAGALAAWATDWLGPHNVRRTRVRWKKPCFPGTVLTLSGEIVEVEQVDGGSQLHLELRAIDQDADVCVQAWMTFIAPEPS